jgi:hypothetical protein
MVDFIAFYRVSTDASELAVLRLAAQRHAVAGFIGSGQLIAEHTEIERLPERWRQVETFSRDLSPV